MRALRIGSLCTLLGGIGFNPGHSLKANTVTPLDVFTGNGQDGSDPGGFATMGGQIYFFANPDSNPNGDSLYRTDGTAGNTVKVVDLPDFVDGPVAVAGGSTLYFFVGDPYSSSYQLWKTNGTAVGTVMVKDISPAMPYVNASTMLGATTNGSQRVYFNYGDPTTGTEIWTSDGTEAGTGMISDFTAGTGDTALDSYGDSGRAVVVGEKLLFVYYDITGTVMGDELWVTDGTEVGTQMLDVNADPSTGSYPSNLTYWNGFAYFTAFDGSFDHVIMKSDGTEANTTVFAGDTGAFTADTVRGMCPVDSNLYVVGTSTNVDPQINSLWILNAAGTATELKELPANNFYANIMWAAGTRLYFTNTLDDVNFYYNELWTSNGTAVGTVLVKQLHPGHGGTYFPRGAHAAIGNTTVFVAGSDSDTFSSIFKSDGTAAGTVSVYDDPDQGGIYQYMGGTTHLAGNGTTVVFGGTDANGTEPWKTTGTTATALVNLNTSTYPNSGGPHSITAFGTGVFVGLRNAAAGMEPWIVNGTTTPPTPSLLKDARVGPRSSSPGSAIVLGTRVIFEAHNGVNGWEPWVSDGFASGTTLLKDTEPGAYSGGFHSPVVMGGNVYYRNYSSSVIGKTNGTLAGTTTFDLPEDISFISGNLAATSNSLYFAALVAPPLSDILGVELIKSNGTEAGTVLVKNINENPFSDSNPASLTGIGTILYFTADDGVNGRELWKTDGTGANTVLVKDINTAGDAFLYESSHTEAQDPKMINVNGTLFFVADDGATGPELWKSNGTEAGTVLVKDINAGPGLGSAPHSFEVVGTTLYFVANDGINGEELWKSDGTEAGTVLVKDIWAGPSGMTDGYYDPSYMAGLNGKLYFLANDGTNGSELWTTDGTSAGTIMVTNTVMAGDPTASSYPYNLVTSNGKLYFSADTGSGEELHVLTQVLSPEITVEQPVDNGLVDGSATINFGSVPLSSPEPRTFTIRNQGSANLTGLAVTKSGTNMADYTVSALGATTLAPGASTTFTVTFNTTTAGLRTAALAIASNDADENPFNINLTATGTTPGGVITLGSTLIQVNESAGVVNIPVVRTGGSGAVNVNVTSTNGTATAGAVPANDYVAISGPVAVPVDTTVNVPITIHNPAGTNESNETFTVTLSAPTGGAVLSGPTVATVRIIDSVDGVAPSAPTITTPAAAALVPVATGDPVTITGSATDNKGVGSVKVKLGDGAFVDAVLATPGATTSTWTINTLVPVTGLNVITAQTFDTLGLGSATLATRSFTTTRPLVVNISGAGTVTAGFAGSTFREVGKSLTITGTATAAPAPGSIFTGWTVGWAGNTPTPPAVPTTPAESAARIGTPLASLGKQTLTFLFREGMQLTANFIPSPYPVLAGTYNGLVEMETADPGVSPLSTEGFFNATLQNTGAFTGKLTIDSFVLNVAGAFDENGVARFGTARSTKVVVPRTNKPSLTLELSVTMTPPFEITGVVTQTGFQQSDIISTSIVDADRAHYGAMVLTGSITNTQATVTLPSTAGRSVNEIVTGTGIPAGTIISAVNGPTQLTLNKNATATNAAVALTFTRDVDGYYLGAAGANGVSTMVLPPKDPYYSRTGTFTDATDYFDPGMTTEFEDGDPVRLLDYGNLPSGLNTNDTFYVANKTGNLFQLVDGSSNTINFSEDGAGEVALDPENRQTAGYERIDYPQGYGVGSVTITKAGVVTVTATLAEGTAVTASSTLSEPSPDSVFAVFAQLYNKLGFISGLVSLDKLDPESDMSATDMKWLRPLQTTSHYYPAGWPESIKVDLLGARYAAVANQSIIKASGGGNIQAADADGNVELEVGDGQLSEMLIKYANLSVADVVVKVPDNDPTFTLSVNRTTGAVTGTFTHTDDTLPSFNGITYQKGPFAGGYGYFLTKQPAVIDFTGESGWMHLHGVAPIAP